MNKYTKHLSKHLSFKNKQKNIYLKSSWKKRKERGKKALSLCSLCPFFLPGAFHDLTRVSPILYMIAVQVVVVDKPKSGLAPQTNYAIVVWRKKKKINKKSASERAWRGRWLAKWLQSRSNATTGQKNGDLYILLRAPLYPWHKQRRYSMRNDGAGPGDNQECGEVMMHT